MRKHVWVGLRESPPDNDWKNGLHLSPGASLLQRASIILAAPPHRNWTGVGIEIARRELLPSLDGGGSFFIIFEQICSDLITFLSNLITFPLIFEVARPQI